VIWIPEKFSKKGRIIKFKGSRVLNCKPYDSENGWEIVEVWSRAPADLVELYSSQHRNQRRESDI
jgi:hypothetical protein